MTPVPTPGQFRQENMEKWARTLLEDEYSDTIQSESRGEPKKVSGWAELERLCSLRPAIGKVLDVGCGSGVSNADYFLDPNPRAGGEKVRAGWMENIPLTNLGRIVCWGAFCFMRSPIEALMEANRALAIGGDFIFDVVTYTTLPLCQTVNGDSFLKHLALHGFHVQGATNFGKHYHKRMGILAVKDAEWSPDRFRMLQAASRPNNWVEARDWYIWSDKPCV